MEMNFARNHRLVSSLQIIVQTVAALARTRDTGSDFRATRPIFDLRAHHVTLAADMQSRPTRNRSEKPQIDAAIAIVIRGGLVLVSQRKDDDSFGGYWEFPGGKCEAGESLEQCLARELREELDISASPVRQLAAVEHDYPTALVRLHPFICRHDAGEPKFIECQDARWIAPVALRDYRFPPANDGLIEAVIALLQGGCASIG
jgi:mutator protein MutT